MRSYTDPGNLTRTNQNREARYLLGSTPRSLFCDNAFYAGSGDIAERWFDRYAHRVNNFFGLDSVRRHAVTKREAIEARRAAA